MSYNPKTKIIELEEVVIGDEVFYLTSKEKEDLKSCAKVSKMNELKNKKNELIIALIVGVIFLALMVWIICNPVNAILYGLIYVLPALLLIKCILMLILPPKPKCFDAKYYNKHHIRSLWW